MLHKHSLMEKIHVTPINDLKEHVENINCPCNPAKNIKNK